MMVFTHMKIGFNLYWKARKKPERQTFKLNPVRFIYGNIKPDISEMAIQKHHLSETYDCFLRHWKRVSDEGLTPGQRSEALGVAAHFISDYFCLYHAKSPYNHYHILRHFSYELKLHLMADLTDLKDLIAGKQASVDQGRPSNQSFQDTLVELLKDYLEGEESCLKDLSYTYMALEKLMQLALEKEESHANCHLHGHVFTSGERRNQYA